MKFVENSRRIALRSYSMWANYLGLAVLIAPEVIYGLSDIDTNPRLWWIIGIGLILFGIVGRLVSQGIARSPGIVALAALFLAMGQWFAAPPPPPVEHASKYSQAEFLAVAVPLIGEWEGLRLEAYQDIVGVWTVCYGETRGVRPGDRYSAAKCRALLAERVVEFQTGWHRYLTAETKGTRLSSHRDAAFTSLAYNVGISGAGKSTATRRLNAGNIAGACEAITWWNKAGQRVVRGLVRRRAAEYDLCMRGVV
ncbi:lysozyme [Roseovarius mucosus]|uniref:lysozyme n=1 Tax=Roseovarius mucosus TaxID=215743 RepID=UPI001C5FA655|nr:lysozyme [Roseovarius mucosus]MBW4972073.1 lysozyme [Roseovarius mucosus]